MTQSGKYLYILELSPQRDPDAQWYVGTTDDPEQRFEEHRSSSASAKWVDRNAVKDTYLLGTIEKQAMLAAETELTRILMTQFGLDSTRGGKYTAVEINSWSRISPAGISSEVVSKLADVDHNELAAIGQRYQQLSAAWSHPIHANPIGVATAKTSYSRYRVRGLVARVQRSLPDGTPAWVSDSVQIEGVRICEVAPKVWDDDGPIATAAGLSARETSAVQHAHRQMAMKLLRESDQATFDSVSTQNVVLTATDCL